MSNEFMKRINTDKMAEELRKCVRSEPFQKSVSEFRAAVLNFYRVASSAGAAICDQKAGVIRSANSNE